MISAQYPELTWVVSRSLQINFYYLFEKYITCTIYEFTPKLSMVDI